jgi:hypothetical protein
MGLKIYKNKTTGEERRSLKRLPETDWEEIISAPNQKFMVSANKGTGTSKLKDSDTMLKSRSRNHSRDVLGDDTIQTNLDMGSKESVARNLLNEKGQRRRKIDDI